MTKTTAAQTISLVRSLMDYRVFPDNLETMAEQAAARSREAIAKMEALPVDSPDRAEYNGAALAAMGEQIAIMDALRLYPLVRGVTNHAMAKYDKGWDIVIEATSTEELIEAIGGSRSVHGAISRVAKVLAIKTRKSYADDIRNA